MSIAKQALRGMSTVEALISLAIMAIVSSFLLPLISFETNNAGNIYKLETIKKMMELNLVEMKARPFKDLPNVDTCLLRKYDFSGTLLAEQSVAITSPNCGAAIGNGFQISISVSRPNPSVTPFTYTPSQFLKMPVYSDKLRQVHIVGCPENNVTSGCGIGKFAVTVIRR